MSFHVTAPTVQETDDLIVSSLVSHGTDVEEPAPGEYVVKPYAKEYVFCTKKKVPKVGVMLVGLGGNNGSSFAGMIMANKHKVKWMTKRGEMSANFYGSLTQATTIRLGKCGEKDVHIPFKNVLPMVEPTDLAIGGWDINNMPLGDAMRRAQVFDFELQNELYKYMQPIVPLPSIYDPDYVAANQEERANNVITLPTKQAKLEKVREDMRNFKKEHNLDTLVILWTANTERFSEITEGIHDTADNLLKGIKNNEKEISPSTMFAVAAILEGNPFINGSPQNTLVPGVVELALRHQVFISGADFKTGQTKIKSVLTDFLVSSGLKPRSIVSYNHLGNNDGANLSAAKTFKSKETSKMHVVDDIFLSNPVLYPNPEKDQPDHCIVIKYIPFVQDSKRAMDEYSSEICMGGLNTIVLHNTCEDSLLAIPVMLDLVVLTELFTRIRIGERSGKTEKGHDAMKPLPSSKASLLDGVEMFSFHPLLGAILGFLLKAPMFPKGVPVVNSLFKQRQCLENLLRACRGLNTRTCIGLNKMYSAIQIGEEDRKKIGK
ncbi:putative Inositol-3-phosphate synthase 1 [Monocercomonoides exilis]|uniref:putative Inositol-3-phosphate synthase 1 n=1 Tax=Monocercomonoides exilis TaxID=2049356 RepID=UPI00355AC57E|nr:putative Inositol-3-phosphate synthase 1 [Monocercomonoides exilis]|eukprot:MONOS_198.1-p1 / transcript=MONOS_198.1 / gene=MONOS_198 / organism=Monocercomonoides_exilis_PA203 / gene_product=Inositol-3-phosphate synthase 1 / transcript_product=Inositol-3-phosphate synthase 1 / location=Mono_scaffold00003:236534-238398(+) / protein_length=547 / sequence_SO=supercontig / SO=protein_coding / is_pseudo=false